MDREWHSFSQCCLLFFCYFSLVSSFFVVELMEKVCANAAFFNFTIIRAIAPQAGGNTMRHDAGSIDWSMRRPQPTGRTSLSGVSPWHGECFCFFFRLFRCCWLQQRFCSIQLFCAAPYAIFARQMKVKRSTHTSPCTWYAISFHNINCAPKDMLRVCCAIVE